MGNGIRAIVGVPSREREGGIKRLALYVFCFSFILKSAYILYQKCAPDHIFSLWVELSLVFPGMTPILFQSQKGEASKAWSVFDRINWYKLLTSWALAATLHSSSSPWQSYIWKERQMINIKEKVNGVGMQKKGSEKTAAAVVSQMKM